MLEELIEHSIIKHSEDNYWYNITRCSFDGITGTIDDDPIHENDMISLKSIGNLRRWIIINQAGIMYKHHYSRNNIDQICQIVALVWSRSKE